MKRRKLIGLLLIVLILGLTGCGKSNNTSPLLLQDDIFTKRDLEEKIDLSEAKTYTVKDNEKIEINEEGTYVITGTAKNSQIIVNTKDDVKVQLVLDNLTIENANTPCIYVKSADKVFINLMNDNSLMVTESFTNDDETKTDAVIYSKDYLVINGSGKLYISSTSNGITSKDDLKITGGNIEIVCKDDALEASDSISISSGNIKIDSKKDGLHAEYSEDESVGYIYISGGNIEITAADDAVHATTIIQVDGGVLSLSAREGLEGTYIQINDGTINISATDDGINAGKKSNKYEITIEINGGTINIDMGQGDTDAIDSNGNLYINGGTINITAQSGFDFDGEGILSGGSITLNGNKVTELSNQMMGGRGNRRR